MARAATSRRRNIPGLGWLTKKKLTHSSSASSRAYKAGQKSGDTGGFSYWLDRQHLGDISSGLRKQLEARYRAGVEKGEDRFSRQTERAGRRYDALAARKERVAEKKLRAQEIVAEAKIKAAERKIAALDKKIEVAEKKADKGSIAESQFEAIKARMEREIQAQEEHKRAAMAKLNPNHPRRARSRITSAGQQRPNHESLRTSTEYRLGYNLGQTDRQTAQLAKTWAELEATFNANFPAGTRGSALPFFQGYQAGYGLAGPGAGERDAGGRRGRRTNPETDEADGSEEYKQAKRIAELFHGRPVKETLTVRENIHDHDWFAHLGPLVELRIKGLRGGPFRTAKLPFSLKGDDVVNLWTSPDGLQFYLRGGDQEIDLKALGMGPDTDWYRDFMALGEVTYFVYRDAKKFHRFKITDYNHKVGSGLDWTGTRHVQNTNAKPVMIYDSQSKKISFAGGKGKVETENLVDGMSPGVVN